MGYVEANVAYGTGNGFFSIVRLITIMPDKPYGAALCIAMVRVLSLSVAMMALIMRT